MEETRRRYPEGCPTGSAVITGAGNLHAKYIIHAVGPVWSGGNRGEETLLASAYRTSLDLAAAHDCRSVAMPALSTGAYGYPLTEAARVAVKTSRDFLFELASGHSLELLRFVLFSKEALRAFEAAM